MVVSSTLGYKESELVGRPFADLFLERDALDRHQLLSMLSENNRANFDIDVKSRDDRLVPMNFSLSPYSVDDKLAGFVSIGRDMSDRRKLEAELRQAQKLESIGTLAGGIAHDFNNILQIFQFNTAGLREKASNPAKLEKCIETNEQAVERGAQLVHQILAFARKTDVKMEQVDLNKFIPDLISLTSQTFPRTITFDFLPGVSIPPIQGDKNQISQVLVNLLVNARDAMPTGGQIKIRTEVVEARRVAERFPSPLNVPYVLLKVQDNGHGMDDVTKQRIFEPFFTMKALEKGTGLGLAVVYGILKTHKGFVDVESAVGVGSTFCLYFPILKSSSPTLEENKHQVRGDLRGSEPILIVEDEEDLLTEMETAFSGHGYEVFVARDGLEAVEVFRKHFRKIRLLLTDIGLPVMSGWEAYMRMKEVNPLLDVVVISGYLDPEMLTEKRQEGMEIVITKPFDIYHLLHLVRQVLDEVTTAKEFVRS
ncbi:MAG: response regulator [Ignavibacteriae bacterium]|nr:response regulator [Ignavibacteria bacterium]MBI3363442.1 response regulator [Ignavibacteriota bacterium]